MIESTRVGDTAWTWLLVKNDSPAIGDQFGSEEKPAKRGLFGECFYFSQKQLKGIFVAVYAFLFT